MSEDNRSSQNLKEDDPTISSSVQEGILADAVGGVQEGMLTSAVGGVQEGMLTGDAGGVQEGLVTGDAGAAILEELLLGAAVVCEDAPTASGSVSKPSIILGIEDVQQAYLLSARNRIDEFRGIKNELLQTIRGLKQAARRNPGNWATFENLRKEIKNSYALLDKVKEAISVQETREEYMKSQISEFPERRREQGENFKVASVRVGTIEGVDVTVKTDYIARDGEKEGETSVRPEIDKDKIALAFIDRVMTTGVVGVGEGESTEESEMEEGAVGMEVDEAADEPLMEIAADANMAEDEDDGRLPIPIVTGKYTMAIRAHHMYPEFSSEDSSQEECEHCRQRNALQGNVEVEEGTDKDDGSSEESSHQL